MESERQVTLRGLGQSPREQAERPREQRPGYPAGRFSDQLAAAMPAWHYTHDAGDCVPQTTKQPRALKTLPMTYVTM